MNNINSYKLFENKSESLSPRDIKLLIMLLEDLREDRSNMSCNDANKDEEDLFTEEERLKISREIWDEDEDCYLFNFNYVEYIIDKIKNDPQYKWIFESDKFNLT